MKTLQDLFKAAADYIESQDYMNSQGYNQLFFDYSGHVNKCSIRWFAKWEADSEPHKEMNVYLTESGVQAAYWFIKTL